MFHARQKQPSYFPVYALNRRCLHKGIYHRDELDDARVRADLEIRKEVDQSAMEGKKRQGFAKYINRTRILRGQALLEVPLELFLAS